MTRRRRPLSAEEFALWSQVTDGVAPLKRRRKPAKAALPPPAEPVPVADGAAPKPPKPRPKVKSAPPTPRAVPPPPPPLTPLAPLDRHERRRLARGTRSIDGRIDLHGMRQGEAHGALRGFLHHAQAQGYGVVLVITGKGRDSARDGEAGSFAQTERGILRRVVPHWLRMPELRPLVVGFEEAHQGHGGGGALYVRLRRSRRAPSA